jgi:hypothetical protein
LSEWAEVEKEVDLCGPDLGPALHLLAQRALTLTWASGSAIALVNKLRPSEMICRARAGTDSPEIGARLQVGSGFSGECIRAGKPIICDDSEYDSRVDRASCRALGIRSIVACPVKRNAEVVGIVEIFSPEPAAFWENDVSILQRLCGLVLRAVQRAEHVRADVLEFPGPGESIDAPEAEQGLEFSPLLARELSRRQRIILAAAGSVFIAILGWVIAPWAANLDSATSSFAAPSSAEANTSDDTYITANFKDLQKLAGQGNVRAEYALGMRYASGEGVKQDYHQAMHYFLRSAEAGDLRGQAKAATWFWAGRGVNQDYSKAYFWGLLAQAGGDNTGRAIVLQCAPYLSPAQITAEQKQAEQWLHSHHIGHDDSTQ